MAIIALKAWYLQKYEPIKELEKRHHDLRLSKNSLLKSGLRADFLDDSQDVKNSEWFKRYLAGETVEFYIEGSGGYAISNIDLISHEIYFTKREVMAQLSPIIFVSYQTEYSASSEALRSTLSDTLDTFNQRSRLPLTLEESRRPIGQPMRLGSTQMRKIRKSLVFIADGTPVAGLATENKPLLIPSPYVCVEIGYALTAKPTEQILLVKMERPDLPGQFPFDLPSYQQLIYQSPQELRQMLPTVMENLLKRFNLSI
ncbi:MULTISPECIES: hypothetical protein [Moorena]|uniref:Uncharacterized protein n=1 Tax=Moorena producens 3L TaxID=489825 RepID=F4XTV0_9CYAN|nr:MULTISPECIES: hypothetical protein [Moorena]NEP51411.1 hypothetical protein [Moorena sp. SIO3C2]NES85874.1 hypothetical protein [Moorena sp. SIO2B7]EGJ31926.1 hypothetical protein LYNGBM3L_31180 [Moorena producens 3L]NEP31657.1 hypothetical protein [Moorena sp. SIO3B2]NEP64314.1 hypothetical protein [Moorena sp. SIO3A5]